MNRLPKVLQKEIWEYVRGDQTYWKQKFKVPMRELLCHASQLHWARWGGKGDIKTILDSVTDKKGKRGDSLYHWKKREYRHVSFKKMLFDKRFDGYIEDLGADRGSFGPRLF